MLSNLTREELIEHISVTLKDCLHSENQSLRVAALDILLALADIDDFDDVVDIVCLRLSHGLSNVDTMSHAVYVINTLLGTNYTIDEINIDTDKENTL